MCNNKSSRLVTLWSPRPEGLNFRNLDASTARSRQILDPGRREQRKFENYDSGQNTRVSIQDSNLGIDGTGYGHESAVECCPDLGPCQIDE